MLAEPQPSLGRTLGATVVLAGYVGTILAANWAISQYGVIPVGFGQVAPAGVLFAGLAFTLRDLLHKAAGRWVTLAAIGAGAALSFVVASPTLAVASAAAFGLSEVADMAIYEPLRQRQWLLAVGLSNTVGLVVDSALFLWLAFGSLGFFWGQVVGKGWMTLAAVVVLAAGRWAYRWAAA